LVGAATIVAIAVARITHLAKVVVPPGVDIAIGLECETVDEAAIRRADAKQERRPKRLGRRAVARTIPELSGTVSAESADGTIGEYQQAVMSASADCTDVRCESDFDRIRLVAAPDVGTNLSVVCSTPAPDRSVISEGE
jgi:hypothetical protein